MERRNPKARTEMPMFTRPASLARLVAALAVLTAWVVLVPAVSQAQPDTITIMVKNVFTHPSRAAVPFPHDAHMGKYDCLTCHHKFKDKKNVLDAADLEEGKPGVKCADCHAKPGTKPAPDLDAAKLGLMQAYHNQCLACHRTEAAKGDKTGPRTCNGCHKGK